MIIRYAIEEDIEQLVELCKLHAAFEKASLKENNMVGDLKKHLFNKGDIVKCLVVENHGNLVGYATFMKQFSTWDASFYMYLDCLYFKETERGKGLGTLLMDKIKAYAVSVDCDHIQWQTPSFNTKAIQFYKKIGATAKSKERFTWYI